jgi:hypothetical protein
MTMSRIDVDAVLRGGPQGGDCASRRTEQGQYTPTTDIESRVHELSLSSELICCID